MEHRPLASIKHSLMDTKGVHQAFSNGPHRGREDLNTHNVKACQLTCLFCCEICARFGSANRKFVVQSPGQNVHLYSSEVSAKMAKNKNEKDKETGKRKPRKSKIGKQKQREKNSERMTIFNRRKEKEEALKDMNARETALEKLGIKDRFEPTVFVAPLDVQATKNAHARRSRAIYEAHFGK